MSATRTCARMVAGFSLTAVLATAAVLPSAAAQRPAAVDPTTISAIVAAAKAAVAKQQKASTSTTGAEQALERSSKRLDRAEHALAAARERLIRLDESIEQAADRRLDGRTGLLGVAADATQLAADVGGVVAPVVVALGPLAEVVGEDQPQKQPKPELSGADRQLRSARADAVRDHRVAADEVASAQEAVAAAAGALAAAHEAEHKATAMADAADKEANALVASLRIDERLVRPGVGAVSSPYGMRTHPVTGAFKAHTGVDFEYADGRAYAAAEGTVSDVRADPAYGNLITIAHGRGIRTRYAHLAATSVHPGEHVSAGQVIGRIGSTGLATGPHLHFEVQVNGRFRDPGDWLGLLAT
jgi:murein DD-endopeptidase MepM/ murein hydrolase activator NlpD